MPLAKIWSFATNSAKKSLIPRGMGLNWWDLSTSKNTRIREGVTLQFRAEFINALNHTHFSTPNMDPTSAAFATITSTSQQPRNIQFGLRLMF